MQDLSIILYTITTFFSASIPHRSVLRCRGLLRGAVLAAGCSLVAGALGENVLLAGDAMMRTA